MWFIFDLLASKCGPLYETQEGCLRFSPVQVTNWLSRRLVTCQPVSAQGTLLPTCLITHAKIWNELLIPFFFFSSTHAKGKKRAHYFKCLLKSDFSGIMLGINLASCSQPFFPVPLQTQACFQFTANFSVVPAHSEKVEMLGGEAAAGSGGTYSEQNKARMRHR